MTSTRKRVNYVGPESITILGTRGIYGVQPESMVFKAFTVGEAICTKKGYRGVRNDSKWTQYLLSAITNDDAELVSIALQSPLANARACVAGGDFGSTLHIGSVSFYADWQFERQKEVLRQEEEEKRSGHYITTLEREEIDDIVGAKAKYALTPFHDITKDAVAGDTFLTIAARKGSMEVIKALLEHNADVFAANSRGETPTMCVRAYFVGLCEDLRVLTRKLDRAMAGEVLMTPSELFAHEEKEEGVLRGIRRVSIIASLFADNMVHRLNTSIADADKRLERLEVLGIGDSVDAETFLEVSRRKQAMEELPKLHGLKRDCADKLAPYEDEDSMGPMEVSGGVDMSQGHALRSMPTASKLLGDAASAMSGAGASAIGDRSASSSALHAGLGSPTASTRMLASSSSSSPSIQRNSSIGALGQVPKPGLNRLASMSNIALAGMSVGQAKNVWRSKLHNMHERRGQVIKARNEAQASTEQSFVAVDLDALKRGKIQSAEAAAEEAQALLEIATATKEPSAGGLKRSASVVSSLGDVGGTERTLLSRASSSTLSVAPPPIKHTHTLNRQSSVGVQFTADTTGGDDNVSITSLDSSDSLDAVGAAMMTVNKLFGDRAMHRPRGTPPTPTMEAVTSAQPFSTSRSNVLATGANGILASEWRGSVSGAPALSPTPSSSSMPGQAPPMQRRGSALGSLMRTSSAPRSTRDETESVMTSTSAAAGSESNGRLARMNSVASVMTTTPDSEGLQRRSSMDESSEADGSRVSGMRLRRRQSILRASAMFNEDDSIGKALSANSKLSAAAVDAQKAAEEADTEGRMIVPTRKASLSYTGTPGAGLGAMLSRRGSAMSMVKAAVKAEKNKEKKVEKFIAVSEADDLGAILLK